MTETISAKDLTKLIKACKLNGVSEFKCGPIEIKFGTGEAAELVSTGETVRTPTKKELEQIQELSLLQRNADEAEDEMAFMAIENPGLFEELLVQNDLGINEDEGENDDNVRAEEKTA